MRVDNKDVKDMTMEQILELREESDKNVVINVVLDSND